ncbi:hypothetical protein TWF506_009159 [Arthrobotrys conoides]|uniref:Uncharacterized protein n=1 Tax=Arthrobotrys conoides TaxID=74498 RepID=A0AAN8RXK8_9PEZI
MASNASSAPVFPPSSRIPNGSGFINGSIPSRPESSIPPPLLAYASTGSRGSTSTITRPPPLPTLINTTRPRNQLLDVHEIIQSSSKQELQNYLDALIQADGKNQARIQKYHLQNLQLREQRQRVLMHRTAAAEAGIIASASAPAAHTYTPASGGVSVSAPPPTTPIITANAAVRRGQANHAPPPPPPPPPPAITPRNGNIPIREIGNGGNGGNGGTNAANSTRKRKASSPQIQTPITISICITCFQSFDESENHNAACKSHPGPWEADPDHDMWGDMIDGGDDRDENHEDFFNDCPDAFIMECCGRRGDTEGCVVFRHVSRFAGYGNGNGGGGNEEFHPSAGVVPVDNGRRRRRVQEPESEDPYGDEEEDEDDYY